MTAIIDGDSLIYICSWNKIFKCWSTDNEFINDNIDKLLSKIFLRVKALDYIGFIGGKKSFRNEIDDQYKINRKDLVKPTMIGFTKQHLIDKWGFIKLDYLESDDAVRICKVNITDSIICSNDKDIFSLEGTHYNYKKDEFITTSRFDARYKFCCSLITGDSADGIKGLVGKGISFANNILKDKLEDEWLYIILKEYINHYGEAEGINLFNKNYQLLYIKEYHKDFILPSPIKIESNMLII
jgi:5'-3' exonuclease